MVDIDKLSTKLKSCLDADELAFIERMLSITRTSPFICGTGGEEDSGGLHESYQICPAFGSDYIATYKRVK